MSWSLLTYLYRKRELSYNTLNGSIPSTIGNLTNLILLYLFISESYLSSISNEKFQMIKIISREQPHGINSFNNRKLEDAWKIVSLWFLFVDFLVSDGCLFPWFLGIFPTTASPDQFLPFLETSHLFKFCEFSNHKFTLKDSVFDWNAKHWIAFVSARNLKVISMETLSLELFLHFYRTWAPHRCTQTSTTTSSVVQLLLGAAQIFA